VFLLIRIGNEGVLEHAKILQLGTVEGVLEWKNMKLTDSSMT